MSLIKKELTEKSGFTIEFSVSKEVYDKAEMEAYKKNVKTINVPGFRKGKAPKSIIERMYGKGVFFEDAINACIPEAFEEAVREADLKIVGQPVFDVVSTDGDIVLKAEGYVYPTVSVKDYKGIQVEKNVEAVTDEAVDAEVEAARKRNARTINVSDRACAMGDIANIDYEGFVDGVAFDGGKGEGHDLKLGSGSFIPGFEEQVAGHNVGEEFDVNVTFPTEYHASELAGKAATFKTKLNSIKFEELPELDDEFAKDVSEFDTLAEYKADVKAKIEKRNEDRAESEIGNTLALSLIERLEGDIPQAMFDAETENMVRDYDNRLRQNGLDLNTYFKYTGLTLDALRDQMRPQAEQQVKVRLALEKIAEFESLTVTDEEIDAEYEKISTMYNVPLDEVKRMILSDDLKADILVGNAMKFVRDNAKVGKAKKVAEKKAAKSDAEPAKKTEKKTTVKSDEKKPAAKKTAAKKDDAKDTAAEEKKPARKPRAKKTEE